VTITLKVKDVLRTPSLFVSNWRLGVKGVLLLTDHDFRIYHQDENGLDEQAYLWIDDPIAATKIREGLPPPKDGWWYFGSALIEAWPRQDPKGWVLHEVIEVWLEDVDLGAGRERLYRIKIRPHPWGWERSY